VKIIKCSEPTCSRHRGFDNKITKIYDSTSDPAPAAWTCDWHSDPNTGAADHVRAVEWSRAVAASVDRS
jgi:hypothetical protein